MTTNLLKGSERKFLIKMQPVNDVHLEDCIVQVSAYDSPSNIVPIDDSNVIKEDADTLKVILTKDVVDAINGLKIKFRIHIGIPDSDFPDDYKNQIYDVIP